MDSVCSAVMIPVRIFHIKNCDRLPVAKASLTRTHFEFPGGESSAEHRQNTGRTPTTASKLSFPLVRVVQRHDKCSAHLHASIPTAGNDGVVRTEACSVVEPKAFPCGSGCAQSGSWSQVILIDRLIRFLVAGRAGA